MVHFSLYKENVSWCLLTKQESLQFSFYLQLGFILFNYWCNFIEVVNYLDLNEMPVEKVRWELCKDYASSFEQILEAAPYKTAAVGLFTSHYTNHPRQTCRALPVN